jgi:23S rRNA (guanosine2251-2'-O)-methyltransferase
MKNPKEIIFGIHAVTSLLQNNPKRILQLYLLKTRQDKKIESIMHLARELNLSIELMSKEDLDEMTSQATHQGVVAKTAREQNYSEKDLSSLLETIEGSPLLLILDGVQDPHNLGACLRSANAAGVHAVIAPKDKSVGLTAVVQKVASGAAEVTPFIQVTNLARTMENLKSLGVWLFGAAEEAPQSLYQTDLSGPAAIVLGAEGTGLRRLTRENCDVLVKIPMLGSVSSLNVSVATGIFLFEAVRQRIGFKH